MTAAVAVNDDGHGKTSREAVKLRQSPGSRAGHPSAQQFQNEEEPSSEVKGLAAHR
jgi:hypothetical protein